MTRSPRPLLRPGLAGAAFLAGILLLILGLLGGCALEPTAVEEAGEEPAASAEAAPTPAKAPPPRKAPQPTKVAAKPKPTAKPLTRSQENAVETAASYLDGAAFSRKGLIEQLEFEGYPKADAKFAVNFLEKRKLVDWKAEAAEAAKSYLDGSSFSRKGLIEQLEFEGYTHAQAVHGVNAAGL